MSFICEECGRVQPARSKPEKKIVEKRSKSYPRRERGDTVIDSGGTGWEIVKEITVCGSCIE